MKHEDHKAEIIPLFFKGDWCTLCGALEDKEKWEHLSTHVAEGKVFRDRRTWDHVSTPPKLKLINLSLNEAEVALILKIMHQGLFWGSLEDRDAIHAGSNNLFLPL